MKTGKSHARLFLASLLSLSAAGVAGGQVAAPLKLPQGTAAAAPAAAPASAPARKTVKPPQGFKIVSITGRSVLCEPPDEDWIRQRLLILEPASRPTTSPADVLQHLSDRRETLVEQITSDLGLPDGKAAEKLFDDELIPRAKKFRDARIPLVFIATTVDRLRQLVEQGWGADYFVYDKPSDQIIVKTGINLVGDGPTDEALLPVVFGPTDSPDTRAKMVGESIRSAEATLLNEVVSRSQLYVQQGLAQFIGKEVVMPLKLKLDGEWFGFGVPAVLSTKYICLVNGSKLDDVLPKMTAEAPDAPVKSGSLDVLHPSDISTLRPEYVPYYVDAIHRKGALVVFNWSKTAGPTAIPKTLAALRAAPPADGAALIKTIKDVTGADLAPQLGPQAQ